MGGFVVGGTHEVTVGGPGDFELPCCVTFAQPQGAGGHGAENAGGGVEVRVTEGGVREGGQVFERGGALVSSEEGEEALVEGKFAFDFAEDRTEARHG